MGQLLCERQDRKKVPISDLLPPNVLGGLKGAFSFIKASC